MLPVPAPDEASAVRFVSTGVHDVMLTVTGAVDDALAERCVGLLRVARRTGARNVLVDLTEASGGPPARLVDVLVQLRADLTSVGGWLIVDGAPDGAGIPEPDLAVAFDAYRHACDEPAATGATPPMPVAASPALQPV